MACLVLDMNRMKCFFFLSTIHLWQILRGIINWARKNDGVNKCSSFFFVLLHIPVGWLKVLEAERKLWKWKTQKSNSKWLESSARIFLSLFRRISINRDWMENIFFDSSNASIHPLMDWQFIYFLSGKRKICNERENNTSRKN
jgi:hypothetical protein